jgi:hypothetical protein
MILKLFTQQVLFLNQIIYNIPSFLMEEEVREI